MSQVELSVNTADGATIFVRKFEPEHSVHGVVVIAHGISEHSARYERFAEELNENGYAVYVHDQREHGHTGGTHPDSNIIHHMAVDVHLLYEKAVNEYPEVPIFVFGHSMGTVVARHYVQEFKGIKGVILCAPVHLLNEAEEIRGVAEKIIAEQGRETRSGELIQSTFAPLNEQFQPQRTPFDWLSRDEAEVDKYIEDPLSGGPATTGLMYDMMNAVLENDKKENIDKVSKDLPILIISGDKDPVTANSEGAIYMEERFKGANLHVQLINYEGARHELLNERNRDEVIEDVIAWLQNHQ